MIALKNSYNAIFNTVTANCSWAGVPVPQRDDSYKSVNCMGFIDVEDVRRWPGKRKPVNMLILLS